MTKIVIFGANGQLGKDFLTSLKKEKGFETYPFTKNDCDITDFKKVSNGIKSINPEYVINCAAYTKVDDAEDYSLIANQINHLAVENLSNLSNLLGFTLIHFSTDYVYESNDASPISEDDRKKPINIYAKTKLDGDNKIESECNKFYIFRVGWVYGKYGDNFPKKILRTAKMQKEISVVNDQIGSPTPTSLISRTALDIIKKDEDRFGVYNISPNLSCSWYEVANFILKKIEGNPSFALEKVLEITSNDLKSKAKRPSFSFLSNKKITNTFKINTFHDWDYYLSHFIEDLLEENE